MRFQDVLKVSSTSSKSLVFIITVYSYIIKNLLHNNIKLNKNTLVVLGMHLLKLISFFLSVFFQFLLSTQERNLIIFPVSVDNIFSLDYDNFVHYSEEKKPPKNCKD